MSLRRVSEMTPILIAKVGQAFVVGERHNHDPKTEDDGKACSNPYRDSKRSAGHADTSLSGFRTSQKPDLVGGTRRLIPLVAGTVFHRRCALLVSEMPPAATG